MRSIHRPSPWTSHRHRKHGEDLRRELTHAPSKPRLTLSSPSFVRIHLRMGFYLKETRCAFLGTSEIVKRKHGGITKFTGDPRRRGSIKTCEEMEFPDTKPREGPSPLDTPGAQPAPGRRPSLARVPGPKARVPGLRPASAWSAPRVPGLLPEPAQLAPGARPTPRQPPALPRVPRPWTPRCSVLLQLAPLIGPGARGLAPPVPGVIRGAPSPPLITPGARGLGPGCPGSSASSSRPPPGARGWDPPGARPPAAVLPLFVRVPRVFPWVLGV